MSPFCLRACSSQVAISNSINGTINPQNRRRAIMKPSSYGWQLMPINVEIPTFYKEDA